MALVHSSYTSKLYEVRGFKITLPKFWKFGFVTEGKEKPQNWVNFNCVERSARYVKWISQCFFIKWTEEEKGKAELATTLKLKFYNAYDKVALELHLLSKENRVEIYCDCLKTMGDIFQDLV